MKTIVIQLNDIARTFTLNARYDTHYFLEKTLPEFIEKLKEGYLPFRYYSSNLRSGEYIPKATYSDYETKYVYLTIGQFSGSYVSFESLTFLDEVIGSDYESIKVNPGDLVITRSGTVGSVHIFQPPDDKIYIPSHHLAVVAFDERKEIPKEFIRLFLQSQFALNYFWSFATGKGQKEISNWSIKSIPIPLCNNAKEITTSCISIEKEIEELDNKINKNRKEKEIILYKSIFNPN